MGIFFMHIPKTAGTSITAVLEDNMSVVDSMIMKKIRNSYYNNCIDYSLLKAAKVVAGHIPMSVASLMSGPARKIVFLRDPVDLSISTFNYMKKLGEIDQSEDLVDFVTSPRGECIKNIQTKWLSSSFLPNTPTHRESMPFEFGRSVEKMSFVIDDAVLKEAVKNLDDFEFVGIFEQMERSITLMCERFDFKRGPNSIALNVGVYSKTHNEQLTALLKDENRFDMELYRFGKEKFESFDISGGLGTASASSERLAPYAFIDMDDSIRHNGFHLREIWPHWYGVRWTTGASEIYPACEIIPGVEYVCELSVLSIILPDNASNVKILINDTPVNYVLMEAGGVWYYRGIFCFESAVSRPKLEIVVPFATKPSAIGMSADDRTLGLAVKSIKLMPLENCAVNFR